MRKVCFYIGHGVEVRYFLLSGIVQELENRNIQCCLLLRKEIISPVLDEYIYKYNIKTIYLTFTNEDIVPSSFENYFRSIRNARKRIKNIPIYSHFAGNLGNPRKYDKIIISIHYIR